MKCRCSCTCVGRPVKSVLYELVLGIEGNNTEKNSGIELASFPGLPRFFCSLVSIDNKTFFATLLHPCIIVNGNRRIEKTG